MERNINDINREIRAAGFFGDLTKKLISTAGEKAASAIGSKAGEALGSKAGEALGNKFFNRKKAALAAPLNKGDPNQSLKPLKAAPIVEENKGSELIKLLKFKNKPSPQSNIHEIYNRLLSDD